MVDNTKGFTFTWKLENFSMCSYVDLKSPVFVDGFWNIEWCVLLSRDSQDNITLNLNKIVQDPLKIVPQCTFMLESIEPSVVANVVKVINGENKVVIRLTEVLEKKYFLLPQDIMTVHCNLRPTDKISSKLTANGNLDDASNIVRSDCVSRTAIKVFRKSIAWSIRNMNERKEREEILTINLSNVLLESSNLSVSLKLTETPKDHNIPVDISYEIRLTSSQLKDKILYVKCKMTVISASIGHQDFKERTTYYFSANPQVKKFPTFIKPNHLDQYLDQDGTLILLCEFAFSTKDLVHHLGTHYTYVRSVKEYDHHEKTGELISNIMKLYSADGKFCDVAIRAGGVSFPAHKLVLCARSSVFSAMFENDMAEKNSGVVEVSDVEPATLKRMLTFMHCDFMKENMNPAEACKLYRAADKYDVSSLKRWCSILLTSTLSVESVCDVLVLADAHQDNYLKCVVFDFIGDHLKQTICSASWKILMVQDPKLPGEIMYELLLSK